MPRPAVATGTRPLRALHESKVPSICRSVRGLRLVREDEMEPEAFYLVVAPPDAGEDATITLAGDEMFIGPFDSPEAAQQAVGDEDGDVDVVNGDAEPVEGEMGGEELGGELPSELDLPPMEARRRPASRQQEALARRTNQRRAEAMRQSVRRQIMREAEAFMAPTTVKNNTDGVAPDGSGTTDQKGAPAIANQTPQQAGETHVHQAPSAGGGQLGGGMPGAEVLGKPMAGGADTGEDPDLSGAGDGKGPVTVESNHFGIPAGSFVTIADLGTQRRVDSGNVRAVTESKIILESGEEYDLTKYLPRKVF